MVVRRRLASCFYFPRLLFFMACIHSSLSSSIKSLSMFFGSISHVSFWCPCLGMMLVNSKRPGLQLQLACTPHPSSSSSALRFQSLITRLPSVGRLGTWEKELGSNHQHESLALANCRGSSSCS